MATNWICVIDCKSAGECKKRLAADGSCAYEYDAAKVEPQFRWIGEGDPPRSWWANGTKVYRTFADYCD